MFSRIINGLSCHCFSNSSIFQDGFAGIRDNDGGGWGVDRKGLQKAHKIAIKERKEQTKAPGASAVACIDVNYQTVEQDSRRLMPGAAGNHPLKRCLLPLMALLLAGCHCGMESRDGNRHRFNG